MSATPRPTTPTQIEPEPEITPHSGHGKMPIFLLIIWLVNICFFVGYFVTFGLPDLKNWLAK
jgi:hypothetical protein